MTWAEFLVILLLGGILLFLVYYYFSGSSGKVSLRKPMESRIDEYLDRRFESIIDEYSLVRSSRLDGFKQVNGQLLDDGEARAHALEQAETNLSTTFDALDRLLPHDRFLIHAADHRAMEDSRELVAKFRPSRSSQRPASHEGIRGSFAADLRRPTGSETARG